MEEIKCPETRQLVIFDREDAGVHRYPESDANAVKCSGEAERHWGALINKVVTDISATTPGRYLGIPVTCKPANLDRVARRMKEEGDGHSESSPSRRKSLNRVSASSSS